jgi:hypothetical protein
MGLVELLGRYSKMSKPLPVQRKRSRQARRVAQPRVHKVRKRLSADVIASLVHDYKSDQSTTALMHTYKLGKGTVLCMLAEHGVKMRGLGIPEDRLTEAIHLYKSGWSLIRLGEHFGCSGETVRQMLLTAGLAMRPKWYRGPH